MPQDIIKTQLDLLHEYQVPRCVMDEIEYLIKWIAVYTKGEKIEASFVFGPAHDWIRWTVN